MKSKTLKLLLLISLYLFIFSACKKEPTGIDVLHSAKEQLASAKGIQYTFESEWDTRLNQSKFSAFAKIKYVRLNESHHGFGFHAQDEDFEFWYDGNDYKEIDHTEKMIINYDSENIKKDSSYFSNLIIFSANPFELLETNDFESINDVRIEDEKYFTFTKVEKNKSHSDTSKIVRHERIYFIQEATGILDQIKSITIIDQDTAQIITSHFTNYKLDENPFQLVDVTSFEGMNYKEVREEDLDNDKYEKQIKVGDRLKQKIYKDMNNEDIALYGNSKKETVIMFSFIGCGGCEVALRKMKERSYQLKDDINFYYSSPQDKKQPLKPYLLKKEFPYQAFSKESNMNEDFLIYSFPTFVMVDAEGLIIKMIEGYDDEFMNAIFKLEG